MWSKGSQRRWEGAAAPQSTAGSTWSTLTSWAPEGRFQPGPTAAQLHTQRPVWRQQAAARGVPLCGGQAEIHSPFTWSRSIFLHFPLVQQSYMWLNLAVRETTGLELLEGPEKHLHHWMPLGNIRLTAWDGSQGNLSEYSGRGKGVYQQWWTVGTETSTSPPTYQCNHPMKYSSLLWHRDSSHLPLWPERPLCRN